MARTDTLTVPQSWIELTNSNATAVTFQVKAGPVYLVATVGAVAPTDFDNAVIYDVGQGEVGLLLADLAPGTPGANRLYAHSAGPFCSIYISHG